MSWLLDSEKPGGLGSSTRGALSLSVKSIAHGLPMASRGPLAARALQRSLVAYLPARCSTLASPHLLFIFTRSQINTPRALSCMADVERAARLQRLDDSTSSLLEAYAKLIKSAQVHGATEQQVSSFQSSVLVAGLVSIANSDVPGRHRVPTAPCAPPRAAARHR